MGQSKPPQLQNDEVGTAHQVPDIVMIGSNFHQYERRTSSRSLLRETAQYHFPRNVTLGMRGNFWKVFSRIEHYDLSGFEFEWLGRRWALVEFWVLESAEVDFATYLDDKVNIFIIFCLKPVDQPTYIHIRKLGFQHDLDEQAVILDLFSALSGLGMDVFFRTFRHNRGFNSLFTWSHSDANKNLDIAAPMFAFYSFCLLMAWKINRDQTKFNLRVEDAQFRRQMTDLLRIRSQIINIERYFLTRNISNDSEVKRVCRSIQQRLQIRNKVDGFLPLNEAIERHLTTIAQMRADRKTTILNIIAFVVAAVGLPLSAISMMFAISHDTPVIQTGVSVVLEESILVIFLYIIFATFGFTISVVFIAYLVLRRWFS